jgi:hypothetical protein
MSIINEKTGVPFLWAGTSAVGLVVLVVGAVVTIFSWRQEDRALLSTFQATTQASLYGIDEKITGVSHRLDLFEQSVKLGIDDRWRKADMRLWLFKAKLRYPDLPDTE